MVHIQVRVGVSVSPPATAAARLLTATDRPTAVVPHPPGESLSPQAHTAPFTCAAGYPLPGELDADLASGVCGAASSIHWES